MERVFFILICCITILACSKEEMDNVVTSEGTLVWYGSPAADGCGLVLEVGSKWYLAGSKQNTFIKFSEEDSGRVEVIARYSIVGKEKTVWGCTTTPVKIVDIRRK